MHLTQGLHRSCQQHPAAVATVCGDRFRTFAELADRVARAAGGLRGLGVVAGDRVAIAAPNSDRYLEFLLAVVWCGAIAIPLNVRWSSAEIAYAINDSAAAVLVVGPGAEETASELRTRCPALSVVVPLEPGDCGGIDWDRLIAESDPVDDARRGGSDLAAVVYTGGTTGTPKGVMLSHTNLLSSAMGTLATGEFLCAGGRLLTVAPLFHLAGIWPWLAQLVLGGTQYVLAPFTPEGVAEAIAENEITDVLLVPIMIQGLVGHLEATGRALPTLTHLIYAGSSISESLLHRTRAVLPDVRLIQGYGMTETAPVATLLGPEEHAGGRLRSAGRAAPHTEVRIVDPEGDEVPRGQPGEIVVHGANVMVGYWGKPELTASALVGGGMHTGDVGHMDADGFVYIDDRLKDMIISGGENVYSAEVENALADAPGVSMAAVIGVADPDWGERVHAVVVPAEDAVVTLDALREHCSRRIARYKLPRSVDLVDQLPVSAAGKVLKYQLRRDRSMALRSAGAGSPRMPVR